MIDRNKLLEAFELESSSLRRRQVTKSAIHVTTDSRNSDEVSNNLRLKFLIALWTDL